MKQLSESMVPPELASILPFAQRWGIGDDVDRETALNGATTKELAEISSCLNGVDNQLLVNWLTGSESQRRPPSDEYLAITCLLMAVQSAKVKLKKRSAREQ